MVVLNLSKLKKGYNLGFGAYFLPDFPIKCSLFNFLSIEKVSVTYIFPSQDIKQIVLLSSY